MTESRKEQTQQSQTNPWAPAIPGLQSLLAKYTRQSTDVTGDQTNALGMLRDAASGIPNFTNMGADAVTKLFNSDNSGGIGMLSGAFGDLQKNLSATASGANLDPYKTPGFSDAIKTAINDATNQVKGVYAGSGRDPSGAGSFAQSLGRGITAGISPTIAAQSNKNIADMTDANKTLFGAAGSTAGGISQLLQQQLQNGLAGIGAGAAIPGLSLAPGQANLNVANAAYSQPYGNLSALLGPLLQFGSLGQQSNSSSTTTSTPSLLDSIGTGFTTGGKGLSALGSLFALSDERVKEGIEPIGKTNDGQNLYSYRYVGDDRPQIGLLAQEVEKIDPSNVIEIGGIKAVNYAGALRKSAQIGMLNDMLEAA